MALALTNDGRIDVAALDKWSVAELRDWLADRLKGQDRLWPIDAENFETPESLFIWLWRDANPQSAFVATLGRACGELLPEAWGKPPEPWLRPLLRLVATIRPEACQAFLNRVVIHRNFSPEMREEDMDEAWLDTLAAYDRQSPDLVKVWRQLLHDARFADIAYRALSHDLIQAVWSLPEYYQALTPDERSVLLPEAMRDMLRWHTSTVFATLVRYGGKLSETPGLCGAIDAALKEMDYPPVLARASAPKAPVPPAQESNTTHGDGASVLRDIARERPLAKVA
jgi:hypothetical protein